MQHVEHCGYDEYSQHRKKRGALTEGAVHGLTSFFKRYIPSQATATVSFTTRSNAGSFFGPSRQRKSVSLRVARIFCHSRDTCSAVGRCSGCRSVMGPISASRNSMLLYFYGCVRVVGGTHAGHTYL